MLFAHVGSRSGMSFYSSLSSPDLHFSNGYSSYGGWFHHHGGCLMNNTWTRLKGSAIPQVMRIFRNV
jgi:hypothetical protein